ncbi:hypothetical protein AMJ47_03365 [Parcubacteria bacterium DG_72]|nr:MAG: hypothetical protein AMJ47_03365 [Parcubacteria bacterium DG_72]
MNIFKKYNIKPNKRLGQNFLTDKATVKKIIKAANLKSNDIVLEIGPGFGVLTKQIAKIAKKVIAVEKDSKLCSVFKEELKDYKNVEILNKDILKTNITNYKLLITDSKIIANLPFYITAPVIRKFLEVKNKPKEMILIVQKEVAQRITAKPPKMSILAVSVQVYADSKILFYISKNSFYPKPKVDAALLRVVPRINADLKQIDADKFFKIVKVGFKSPRKQLINNLSKELKIDKEQAATWLEKNNIDPKRRAETLTIQDWKNLCKML